MNAKLSFDLTFDTCQENICTGGIAACSFWDVSGKLPLVHVVSDQKGDLDHTPRAIENYQLGVGCGRCRAAEIEGSADINLTIERNYIRMGVIDRKRAKRLHCSVGRTQLNRQQPNDRQQPAHAI